MDEINQENLNNTEETNETSETPESPKEETAVQEENITCEEAQSETIEDPIIEEEISEEPEMRLTKSQLEELIRNEVAKAQPAKKNHTAAVFGLCALLGLGAGYGGGTMAAHTDSAPQEATAVATPNTEVSHVQATQNDTNITASNMSIKQVAAVAAPSVVEINTITSETISGFYGFGYGRGDNTIQGAAAGSGVILSADGYIITNEHVVENATSISVTTNDGTVYDAELIGKDAKSDIAVLKINAENLTPAKIGDSSLLTVGDTAVVIGNPLGTLGGTVTNGIISATDRTVTINNESMTLLQTNAAINSGNSGGGLFNDQGELVGIVNAKDSGTTSSGTTIEGLGFAIPINEAMDVANQLKESGYVTDRATIGVMLQTLAQDYGNYKAGLYITEVQKGGGAERAGLQPYDRIIAIDDQETTTYQELSAYLKTKNVGDTVSITVVRDGKQMSLDVTLTAPLDTTDNG